MSAKKLLLAGVGIGLSLVLALAIVKQLQVNTTTPPSPEASPSSTNACADVNSLNLSRHDQDPVTVGTTSVAVIGDSYSQGEHLPNPRQDSWPTWLGHDTGWSVRVDGSGGSGFTNGGPCGYHQFDRRAEAATSTGASIVIFQGGLNDLGASPASESLAASAALDATEKVPNVVVIGPMRAPRADPAAVDRTDKALSDSVNSRRRVYISTLRWELPTLPDGLHLTPEGHRLYASRVATMLRSLENQR